MKQLYGPLAPTGIKPKFLDKLAGNGVTVPGNLFARANDAAPSPVRKGA